MGSDNSNLFPAGWIGTQLEIFAINPKNDIVDGPFGSNLRANEYMEQGIPIIRLQNIDRNKFIKKNIKYISETKANTLRRHDFKSGDLLITKLGIPLGKACVVPQDIGWGIIVADIVRIRLNFDLINKKYITYLLNSEKIIRQLEILTKGTTRPRVNLFHIRNLVIPYCPFKEQNRIVEKIEEFFAKIDSGIEGLEKVKAQLKHYRQSVLKAAFSGQLTTEWRKKHSDDVGARLSRPSDFPARKTKNKLATGGATNAPLPNGDMLDLPAGWERTTINELGDIITGTTPPKSNPGYYGDDFPFYKPTDLNFGYYVRDSIDGLSEKGIKKGRYLPEKSVLVTCIGATIGKTGFIRKGGACNQQINAIVAKESILPEYIYFVCISSQFQKTIFDNASATTLPILNKGKFGDLPFPLPPLAEQHQIVSEIERRFSVIDGMEKVVTNALKQAQRLRQSILKRAFEGKLVPQDPNDEPAEKLLERIKAEKAKLAEKKKSRKMK